MAQIFLVRHGKRASMDRHSGLSEKGIMEAKRLAGRFKKELFTKIYISTINRAHHTGMLITKHHGETPTIMTENLGEVHASLSGGKKGEDVYRARTDRKRADNAFSEIFVKAKKNDRILVVCHGNIIRYFLNKILKKPRLDLWHNLHIDSSSVTLVEGYRNIWTIKTINNIDHLYDSHKRKFYNIESERNHS